MGVREEDSVGSKPCAIADHNRGLLDLGAKFYGVQYHLHQMKACQNPPSLRQLDLLIVRESGAQKNCLLAKLRKSLCSFFVSQASPNGASIAETHR